MGCNYTPTPLLSSSYEQTPIDWDNLIDFVASTGDKIQNVDAINHFITYHRAYWKIISVSFAGRDLWYNDKGELVEGTNHCGDKIVSKIDYKSAKENRLSKYQIVILGMRREEVTYFFN